MHVSIYIVAYHAIAMAHDVWRYIRHIARIRHVPIQTRHIIPHIKQHTPFVSQNARPWVVCAQVGRHRMLLIQMNGIVAYVRTIKVNHRVY